MPEVDDFNPVPYASTPSGNIWTSLQAIAVQTDGKVILTGMKDGSGEVTRLLPDGSLDENLVSIWPDPCCFTFANARLFHIASLSDNRMLLTGEFESISNHTGSHGKNIVRTGTDGRIDRSFVVDPWGVYEPGPYSYVAVTRILPDNRILIGGWFNTLNDEQHRNLARLNSDGSVDETFHIAMGLGPIGEILHDGSFVHFLQHLPDGRILVGGNFSWIQGSAINGWARLHPDGSIDESFQADIEINARAVQEVAPLADGRLLVMHSGGFALLAEDGSVVPSEPLAALGEDSRASTWVAHEDGSLLLAGRFDGGVPLVRLMPDLTLDTNYNPEFQNSGEPFVSLMALQSDGSVVIWGTFDSVGGLSRTNYVRLKSVVPATQSLEFEGDSILWRRGGSSPRIRAASFAASVDGVEWNELGIATRTVEGWRLDNATIPANATIRARGHVVSPSHSESHVQYFDGQPIVVKQPESRIRNEGEGVSFFVNAQTSDAFQYQWHKDGTPLEDGPEVSGATEALLILRELTGAATGNYHVVVRRGDDSIDSDPASLQVLDPYFTLQPSSRATVSGQETTLTATAVGTDPITWQWLKDGEPMEEETWSELTLSNMGREDAGRYQLRATGPHGFTDSDAAEVSFNVIDVDPDFAPYKGGEVGAIAIRPDGGILVGRNNTRPVALLADGTLNAGLDFSSLPFAWVRSIGVQPDGTVLFGGGVPGDFGSFPIYIAAVRPNGEMDSSYFHAHEYSSVVMAGDPDGGVFIGGSLLIAQSTAAEGHPVRLLPNGTPDPNFTARVQGAITALAVQPDGRLLVGVATVVAGSVSVRAPYWLTRLNLDGSEDPSFRSTLSDYIDTRAIHSIWVQPDGRILVATGTFLARLHSDGSVDESFGPFFAYENVNSIVQQADGRILVAGSFAYMGDEVRARFARLNLDGTPDPLVNVQWPNVPFQRFLSGVALEDDGGILLSGSFSPVGLAEPFRGYLDRVENTDWAHQALWHLDSKIVWVRTGTAQEIIWARFEYSANGSDWSPIGSGTRLPGRWELDLTEALPAEGWIRGIGYTTGGPKNASFWHVESRASLTDPPIRILNEPGRSQMGTLSFEFHIDGAPGQEVVVEFSPDFDEWDEIESHVLGYGPIRIVHPVPDSGDGGFYRVRRKSAP